MIAVGVLAASIVLQLTAAGLALRLVRVTGWWLAWVCVSAALVLMSLRRCITLYRMLVDDRSLSPDLTAELAALCIAVLMVAGMALIGPAFARAKKMKRDLRHSEAEIRKLNRVLERRVEERTTELHATQDALVRSERLAALGQLTGMVAHELRNPLGAIATSFDVIQNKCEAANLGLDRALGRVKRNIKRCDGLISELLDVTRAKALQPEPTAVDAWLSDLLEEQPIPEHITLNTDLDAAGAAVTFDREQVRRAVINLVDNACQAMAIDGDRDGTGDGAGNGAGNGKQLTVATRRSDGRIEIEVADTGPGIPVDDLTEVLEPLFTTKPCGTGLGLAIVQRIMERHRGGLEITSKKRRGTRVRLWLPTDHGQEEAAPR